VTFDPDAASHMAQSQLDTTSDTGIDARLSGSVPTLGEKLALEAQRIASRHMPDFPWLRLLEPVRERVVSLPVPSQARFQRTEAFPAGSPSQKVSHELFLEAMFSLPQQSVMHPAPDMVKRVVGASSQVWDQPLSSYVQQRQQNFLRTDTETNSVRTESHFGEDIQQQEWGQPLPPLEQQRLRDFVGPGTETIRVHSDEVADALVRPQQADAVTVGHHIFFRKGHFRPREREGFALLTHEATHVIQAMRPDSAWKRATQGGVHEEEQEASVQERLALDTGRGSSFPRQPATPSLRPALASRYPVEPGRPQVAPVPVVSSSPVQRPMAAATDRTVDQQAIPTPSMPDVEELKRTVYRDLIRQIRADLERGG
jgi:hypothetical protein